MKKDPILYFGKDSNERLAVPASKFLGIDPASTTQLQVSFKDADATADGAVVVLDIDSGSTIKEACKVLAGALYGQTRGLTIVADKDNKSYMYPFTAIENIT